MANRIRTEPVSLNESTLETNVAGEIVALFKSPFIFGYPSRLMWLFGYKHINLNTFRARKVKLYRLTPIEENRGGGWDTKIFVPQGSGEERAFFIQFKSGKNSEGNSIAGSIFNSAIKTPNRHVDFEFNNNTGNNQHQTLKNLSVHLQGQGLSPNSVMYGFPRVTSLAAFNNLQDDLLLHTSFLTIPEMDAEAQLAKTNLYDGEEHNFRTCYVDERKREISSEPFQLSMENVNGNILYEIILVKLAHLRNLLTSEIPIEYANEELFLMLADYLKINPFNTHEFNELPNSISNDLKDYFDRLEKQRNSNLGEVFTDGNFEQNYKWRYELFNKVTNFFGANSSPKLEIEKAIPSICSFTLPRKEQIKIDVEQGTSFNLLVF